VCVRSRARGRDTAPGPVHIDDGRGGQHVPGADIPAAVPHGRHRRRRRLRPVPVAVGDERPHAGAGRGWLRHRHVRQRVRDMRRVPEPDVKRLLLQQPQQPQQQQQQQPQQQLYIKNYHVRTTVNAIWSLSGRRHRPPRHYFLYFCFSFFFKP